jgi:hypothetical protein
MDGSGLLALAGWPAGFNELWLIWQDAKKL